MRGEKSIAALETVQAIQTRRGEDLRVCAVYSLKDKHTFLSLLKKKKIKKASTKWAEVVTEVQQVKPGEKWVTGGLREAPQSSRLPAKP